MRKERMNNKGFSLVELIIVIAIMAILAAALAPQLMKYIEKSRVSTDASTCSSIESCVNAALANEDAYKEIAEQASGLTITGSATDATKDFEFYIGAGPKFRWPPTVTTATPVNSFKDELSTSLKSIKAPKQTGMKSYKVTIKIRKTTKQNTGIDASTTATSEDIMEVGDIKVQTVKKDLDATTTP